MKTSAFRLLAAASFTPLTLTLSCSHHSAAVLSKTTLIPSSASLPAAGWGPGSVVAHGYTQSVNHLPKAWPSKSSSIHVADQGGLSIWPGFVKSSGYWQILFRWHGQFPPPKTKYTVSVTTVADTKSTGDVIGSAKACPPSLDNMPISSSSKGMYAKNDGEPVNATVQHDASGFYLVVASSPVYGEARQTKNFHSWGGDITTEVKFTQPTETPNLRRKKHSILKGSG